MWFRNVNWTKRKRLRKPRAKRERKMPLIKSGSRDAISQNIREMVAAGHPQRQAVAAALHTADKYQHRSMGGGLGMPIGNQLAPNAGSLATPMNRPMLAGGGLAPDPSFPL